MTEHRRQYLKNWRKSNRARANGHFRAWYKKMRRLALIRIGRGKLKCSNCGEATYDSLEINHVNGGGNKDFMFRYQRPKFYQGTLIGYRLSEFNLLCGPCNRDHYHRMAKIGKYKVNK